MDASKYAVNYDDERLTSIKAEEQQAKNQTTQMYDQMINNSDKFYQDQINASKEYANKQQQIQQQNTDFAITKIEQEKEKTEKDYTKEQKGAYTDYTKQINNYGVNAEQMAASGLSNSGYSESSKVSMYNTYQNRVATARESLNNAMINYNNSIKEAQLANNSKLAEIAYNALQEQLQLSLQGFQYKNSLIETKQNQLNYLGERYDTKYQNVLAQINQELERQKEIDTFNEQWQLETKKLLEQIRQSDREFELKEKEWEAQKQRWAVDDAQWEKEYALAKKEKEASIRALNNSNLVISDGNNKTSNIRDNVVSELVSEFNAIKGRVSDENYYTIINKKLKNATNNGILTEDEAKAVFEKL